MEDDVCEKCGSKNLRKIITGYEIKGNLYKALTKKCRDCGFERALKESMIPRNFRQKKETE